VWAKGPVGGLGVDVLHVASFVRLPGSTKTHFAKVAYKNHKNSVNNPYSQVRQLPEPGLGSNTTPLTFRSGPLSRAVPRRVYPGSNHHLPSHL